MKARPRREALARRGCVLLVLIAGAQVAQAQTEAHRSDQAQTGDATVQATDTATVVPVPTVSIPRSTPLTVPTVTIPQPTPTATATPKPTPKPKRHPTRHRNRPARRRPAPTPSQVWIWAFLTSYCPAAAGWRSSSGLLVFYGMLANDYYPFGTRVYIPVLGMIGVVEDRIGSLDMWNHFDEWSPVCYSTPTGWFRVAIESR